MVAGGKAISGRVCNGSSETRFSSKANSELSSHQKKIFKVDNLIGVAIAGITVDGGVLSRYMPSECINYGYSYESVLPVDRFVVQLADKAQICTQRFWKRPYGVGLLVGGLDESGAHLYYNCPSGDYFEFQAFAIGSRSQAAKTYLKESFTRKFIPLTFRSH